MNKRTLWTIMLATAAMVAVGLTACQKTTKTSSAGGGASTQSIMTFKGATR